MAKKSLIARDEKRKKFIAKFATVRAAYKKVISDQNVDYDEKDKAQVRMQQISRNASSTRLNRRCEQCGRPHAVYRRFGLCRICLRNVLMLGLVPGARKSSW